MKEILKKIKKDPRYINNIQYGKPRRGHAEGTVEAHIKQLEENLETLSKEGLLTQVYYYKLLVMIHVHDSFKAVSKKNAAIEDAMSHASLAASFFASFIDDQDVKTMIQYHDLGYAIYRNFQSTGRINQKRLEDGLNKIKDKNLFLLFCIIDSCTPSKGREMITWFIKLVKEIYPGLWVTTDHILPGPMTVEGAW